jgi:hypothetical protein
MSDESHDSAGAPRDQGASKIKPIKTIGALALESLAKPYELRPLPREIDASMIT